MNRTALFCLALAVFSPPIAQSQQDARRGNQAPADSTYFLNAGTSSLKEIDGERVLELKDGVRIRHGDITITSDEGRQIVSRRVAVLIGNVHIDQKTLHMDGDEGEYRQDDDEGVLRGNVTIVDRGWTITCDHAVFSRLTDTAWLTGNVVASDTASVLTADSVFYDQRNQIVEGFGDVTVSNERERIIVRGRHGIFHRDRSEAVVDETPRMIIDPETEQPTVVDADTMRFFPDNDRAVASGRVKIVKGEMVTQCDSAVVIDAEKRAELYGNPLAKQDNVSMQANTMFLFYNDEEVNKVRLVEDAAIREAVKDTLVVGRDGWVEGDTIDLYLHDNNLDSLSVTGKASSEYYPTSPDKVESNFVRGEEMFFVFDNDTLSWVRIKGGADGVYRYVDLKSGQTADSLRTVLDTMLVYIPFDKTAETIVYSADSIQYYARERDMILEGTAKIVYGDRTLLAKAIKYNSNLQVMDATGAPVLIEAQDKLQGTQMGYDLDTGVGLVKNGQTKFIQGYYQGEEIAKVGKDVLKVWNSRYTTCDLKVPHYHFTANQMKVYLDDKVVTGPITLYISDTPVLALPFFAQNIRQGRRSGVLRPDFEFGIGSTSGRFIRNIGYYWATNDYMDFTIVGDFNENSRAQFRLDNQYRVRYMFDGGFNYRWLRKLDTYTNEWTVTARHNQAFQSGYKLNANLSFVSSDKAPQEVNNIDQVQNYIDRNIRSTARLSKTWQGIVGFSASATRDQYLNVVTPNAPKLNMTLPSVNLSIPQRTFWFGEKTTRGDVGFWESLLDNVRWSPGLNFSNSYSERTIGAGGAIFPTAPDAIPTTKTNIIASNQSLSFSATGKIMFLNLSPSLGMSNAYTHTHTEGDAFYQQTLIDTMIGGVDTTIVDTVLVTASETSITENRYNWNVGASASTNLYGRFYPDIGIISGIQHRISPTVSYSYRPPRQGRPRAQSFNLGLTNTIDLKVKDGDNGEERKINNAFLWSLGTSYNPDASEKNWSTIRSNMNTQVLGINLSMNNTIDPYERVVSTTQLTSNFSYRGTHGLGLARDPSLLELNPLAAADTADVEVEMSEGGAPALEESPGGGLPWSIRGGFSYSKQKGFPASSTLNFSGQINITANWTLSYSANYDVTARNLQGQYYTLTRDMHCWEMSIARQELGTEWQYYFRITLKAHPELYAEQGPRGLAGGGGIPGQFSY